MHIHDAIGPQNHLPLFTGDIDIMEKLQLGSRNESRYVIETKTIEGLKYSVSGLRDRGLNI